MSDRNKVLAYWNHCLTDTIRSSIDTRKSKVINISLSEYKGGYLSSKALDEAKDKLRLKELKKLNCIIAPSFLKPNHTFYNENKIVYPLFIPVVIDEHQNIKFDSKQQPWIPRDILEPQNNTFQNTFGNVFDYESFLTQRGLLDTDNWKDLLTYISEMKEDVLDLSLNGYIEDSTPKLFLDVHHGQYSTKTILDFYKKLEKDNPEVPLFNNYLKLKENKINTQFFNENELSKGHLGQMSDEYPLSKSQRESLHRFVQSKSGDILAVNGPPGTGKTTLLQSIVATKYVQAVLDDEEWPPIIFASSTNNQAVTNVIDSFGKTEETNDDPEKRKVIGRWLPNLDSYGLYCPSQTKYQKELNEGSKFFMHSPRGEGFLKDYKKNMKEKEHYYLECFSEYANYQEKSLHEAAQWLKQQIKKTINDLQTIIKLVEKRNIFEKRLSKNTILDSIGLSQFKTTYINSMLKLNDKQLSKHDNYLNKRKQNSQGEFVESEIELLDRYHRFMAFKLSIHYWEAMYLIKQEENHPKNMYEQWKESAYLFPCHVSTLFTLPNLFKDWKSGETYYNSIDLLIIDEAGQVSPEIGAPAFSLSRKALVVGDEVQIEPVWNLPKAIDQFNIVRSGLSKKGEAEEKYHQLLEKGITTTGSSVIKTAQKASRFQKVDDIRGMFLSEHRRCQNEIVSYCNELAYDGRLQPLAKKENKFPFLPKIGYAHISGYEEKKGGSRQNISEAETIAEWINQNEKKLLEYSNKDNIEDVIAVITPFTQQKKVITRSLKNKSSKLKDITVGTVHALQGAERDVVIFSSVYSEEGSYFFDAGVNMLNVALSRAKHAFLVFGNMSIFKEEGDKPSNLLAKYLFSSEDNEIRDIEPIKRTQTNVEDIERISTHEGHDKILFDALRHARNKVCITSPFIRSVACNSRLLNEFKETVNRGVDVNVFASATFNFNNGKPLTSAEQAVEGLKQLNVNVQFLPNIHSKTLWVDKDLVVEGSFNWLSAIREKKHKYHNYESSFVYRGDKTRAIIQELEQELNLLLKQTV